MSAERAAMRVAKYLIAGLVAASCSDETDAELGPETDGPIVPDPGTDAPDEPEARIAAQSNCNFVPKIIVYAPSFNSLAAEMVDQMDVVGARCAQYYHMLPAVQAPETCDADGEGCLKLRARTTAEELRARSPHGNFHAMAEFHWHHWAAWIRRSPGTRSWTLAARTFRRDMADAGFDVTAGDTWVINELHSGLRRAVPGARDNVIEAVRALNAGDPAYVSPTTGQRATTRRGVVLAIGIDQTSTNLGLYKDNVRAWLRDAPFWTAMKQNVRYFGQEVYPSPDTVCAPGGSRTSRAASVNAYASHFARLAFAADGTDADAATAVARNYLDTAYFPLLGGVWPSPIYGDTEDLNASQMMRFISVQVYATRLWAASHPYPDARIGIAWKLDGSTDANRQVTTRATNAILSAYSDTGSSAARACGAEGTGCDCSIAGAAFNPSWAAFSRW